MKFDTTLIIANIFLAVGFIADGIDFIFSMISAIIWIMFGVVILLIDIHEYKIDMMTKIRGKKK